MNLFSNILVSAITAVLVIFASFLYTEDSGSGNDLDLKQDILAERKIELDNYSLDSFQQEIIGTVEYVQESVVSIIITKDFIQYERGRASELIQQQVGGGSGLLVTRDGYILTNKHVLVDDDSTYTVIFSDGSSAEVVDVWFDETLDIAMIKIDENEVNNRMPAPIADFSKPIIVGQFALAIGNALAEFQNSVTFGVVSGNNRKLNLESDNVYAGLIQTDTSISEGNSGGPLFNIKGEVIGINTAVSSFGENIGFAIPISHQFVDATIQSIKNNNKIVRPFVGVRYIDIDGATKEELAIVQDSGIFIDQVLPDSPAEKNGLLDGDIITHIDATPINNQRTFMYQLFTKIPGQTIELDVIRGDDSLTIPLRLEDSS